ncbi:hypothetical protein [Vibrio splendidus]|uniref:hypothetical protein n=1 Tax=Vibrio splendidus TaxID=29497 RepID=UPI0034A0BBBA
MKKIVSSTYGLFTAFVFAMYISFYDIYNLSSVVSVLYLGLNFIFIAFVIKRKFDKKIIIFFLLTAMFTFYLVANNALHNIDALSGAYWWLMLSFLVLFRVDMNDIKVESCLFLFLSILVLSIDAYYRFFISDVILSRDSFYSFKYGLIGQDSNFSGIFCIVCVSISILLWKKGMISNKIYYLFILLFVLLTVSTFSRAAIISVFIILLLIHLHRWLVVILISIMPFFIISILSYMFSDPSAESKLELISGGADIFLNYNIKESLFGVGLGNARIGDLTPHILLLQILLDLGLFGVFLYCSIWLCFIWIVGKDALFLLLPYSIVSLSISPLGIGVVTYTLWVFIRLSYISRSNLQTS